MLQLVLKACAVSRPTVAIDFDLKDLEVMETSEKEAMWNLIDITDRCSLATFEEKKRFRSNLIVFSNNLFFAGDINGIDLILVTGKRKICGAAISRILITFKLMVYSYKYIYIYTYTYIYISIISQLQKLIPCFVFFFYERLFLWRLNQNSSNSSCIVT